MADSVPSEILAHVANRRRHSLECLNFSQPNFLFLVQNSHRQLNCYEYEHFPTTKWSAYFMFLRLYSPT